MDAVFAEDLTSTSSQLVQRRLRWFGHAARRPNGEMIRDLLLPTPLRTWRRRTGSQLKTCNEHRAEVLELATFLEGFTVKQDQTEAARARESKCKN